MRKVHPSVRLLDAFFLLATLVVLAGAWECRRAIPWETLIALPLAGIGTILLAFYVVHAPDRRIKHQ